MLNNYKCLLFATIATALSIAAIVISTHTKTVAFKSYQEFIEAQSSKKKGFADRWTGTDQRKYAAEIQKQIDELRQQIQK